MLRRLRPTSRKKRDRTTSKAGQSLGVLSTGRMLILCAQQGAHLRSAFTAEAGWLRIPRPVNLTESVLVRGC
jgi:hypothetical protein